MKRSVVYPDWAEKYRGPGRTIRKVRNGYGLYECTSTYQPGQKYPKSVQTYLGMITEKDGFIPKKTDLTVTPVATRSMEYGLSHFIMANFRRDLMRSVYDASEYMIIYGVIYFIFDDLNEALDLPICVRIKKMNFCRDFRKVYPYHALRQFPKELLN